ncbi:MAG: hypothetical protein J4F42_04590 [Desulfurellaceae bacterium]|nr:hypothetical protein [Desulfurellaceae bacterium]
MRGQDVERSTRMGQAPPEQILLMTQLLVRGDEQVVALGFGTIQQVPIAERCPPQLEGRVDGVPGQTPP